MWGTVCFDRDAGIQEHKLWGNLHFVTRMISDGHGTWKEGKQIRGNRNFLIGLRRIGIDIRTKNFRKPSNFDRYEGHGRAQRKAKILGSPYHLISNPRMTWWKKMENRRKPLFFDRVSSHSPFGEYNILLSGEWGARTPSPPRGSREQCIELHTGSVL